MQPGQVAPNQNFLNRPTGPIPVSHSNVQQQVSAPTCCSVCACCLLLTPPGLVPACFIDDAQCRSGSSSSSSSHLHLLSRLSCVQSVVVGMPPVSQVSMMEEQQRQSSMVRSAGASSAPHGSIENFSVYGQSEVSA